MFHIHFSNRFQHLLDSLLDATTRASESPFHPIDIIIPSAAVQRRLELAMANRFGVCANIRFSYLGQWVWRQIAKIDTVPAISPFSPETLTWRILKILDNPSFVALHSRLRSWMAHADARMRYELAAETASVIDQIITYRPNLIEAWSSNKLICMPNGTRTTAQDQQWQAELWRRLLHEIGSDRHLFAMAKKLDALDDQAIAKLRQNRSTHIFCPSAIPPLTIQMLNRLSQWMEVHLYVLNPCREYWFDIVDRKRLSYLTSLGQADHHETGNVLLAAWGKQTQAMIDLLFENTSLSCTENHSFISNAERGKTTLLAQVQDAILELRDLPVDGMTLAPNDRSIEVHVCHSLTRELEVLQDQLLAMLAGENPLAPDEILVVTPNLQEAAPLIDAVFGTASPSRTIPYTLTGLGNSRINPVAVALLDWLSLAGSRFTASDVFALLQQPLVAQRFGLTETQLKTLHRWMIASGIRWGLDAAHRSDLQMPADDRYTFRDGLHRLFLGLALPADIPQPFGSRLPAGNIEGAEADILGRFQHFITQIDRMQSVVCRAQTASEWETTLTLCLETLIAPIDNQLDDTREVRSRIRELCDTIRGSAPDYPIAREVILRALTQAFDDPARGGVPTGTMTFTSMNSLRHLPYRVVCIIGLNDGVFPTTKRPPEFDLIAHAPQRGDRQRRLDERNLFLDLLLAADDRLYLSYTGRSIRDNSVLPPSVLVSDLIDYLTPAIGPDAPQRLIVEHPLQAFSPDYYRTQGDPRIASSNAEYLDALQKKWATPPPPAQDDATLNHPLDATADEPDDETVSPGDLVGPATPFFSAPLPAPEKMAHEITLDQLLQFFRNPSRYLLRHRLGIRFPEKPEELADEEPFLPERDEQRAISERLLPMYFSGASAESLRAAALAGTEYPPGPLGQALLEKELHAMETFAQAVSKDMTAPCQPAHTATLSFTLDGEVWTLTHTFHDLYPTGLIRYRFDDVRPSDYLSGWLAHLFLNAAKPANVAPNTVWHSRDGQYAIAPVPDAQAQLQSLIALYRQGLCEPLHFYPRTAWEYVRHGRHLGKAQTRWQGGKKEAFAERNDPHYRQALRGVANPLDTAFEACAQIVFEPMLTYLSDPRLE